MPMFSKQGAAELLKDLPGDPSRWQVRTALLIYKSMHNLPAAIA